jgi:dTDP-D-glucose 4,6-dehydratase
VQEKIKILITGGNGFVGTNLILTLLKIKNDKILNIDKISSPSNLYLIINKFMNIKNII